MRSKELKGPRAPDRMLGMRNSRSRSKASGPSPDLSKLIQSSKQILGGLFDIGRRAAGRRPKLTNRKQAAEMKSTGSAPAKLGGLRRTYMAAESIQPRAC